MPNDVITRDPAKPDFSYQEFLRAKKKDQPIGTMHLYFTRGFIDGELVIRKIKFAVRRHETRYLPEMRRCFRFEIAGIVPAAHIHPRDMSAAFVLATPGCRLIPVVDLLANHRRHVRVGILEMRRV